MNEGIKEDIAYIAKINGCSETVLEWAVKLLNWKYSRVFPVSNEAATLYIYITMPKFLEDQVEKIHGFIERETTEHFLFNGRNIDEGQWVKVWAKFEKEIVPTPVSLEPKTRNRKKKAQVKNADAA